MKNKSIIGYYLLSGDSRLILLTSIENQECADKRIPELLKIPAICRGLSIEPLLGPVEFSDVTRRSDAVSQLGRKSLDGIHWLIVGGESGKGARPCNVEWVRSIVEQGKSAGVAVFVKQLGSNVVCRNDNGFDGESPEEFPMDTKIWELTPSDYQGAPVRVLLKDHKGGRVPEWPQDLRVQEWPQGF